MPSSGQFGWRGAWFGAWFGPPLGGSSPGGMTIGTGTIITGGFGGSQIIVQGFGAGGSSVQILASGGMSWGGVLGASVPVASTFLQALVAMLRSSAPLTAEIGAPRVFSTWPGPKVALPFILIEDYVESQPGETIEHNLNTVVLAAYGKDKESVTRALTALMNSTDSPAQNKNSTRTLLRWSTGVEESSWRQPSLPPMRTRMQMYGTDLWCWKIQYDFNILPNFQV